MRIDTMLSGLEEAADHARRLEALGVDGAFTFEGPHDVFTPLVLAAQATTSLELATNVAIAFPRNPVQLAHQAYDLQLLSNGRFTLGLGSQIRAQVEKRYGAGFERPVARMREVVGALRAIFAAWETGEQLDFRGEFTSHTLMPPMFNPGPNPFGVPPIALGGLGPQMVRLAAEVADGVLVMPFNTAAHFRQRTLPAIAEGLARGGRARPPLARPSAIAGRVRCRKWAAVLKGMTRTPSATSAARRTIWGPSPPRAMGGTPKGFGPGLNMGGIRVWEVNSPRKSSCSPVSQAAKMARSAPTTSRIRATGRSNPAP